MSETEREPEFRRADLIISDNEMYDLVVEGRVTLMMPQGKFQPGQVIKVGMPLAKRVNDASHTAIVESVEAKDNRDQVVLKLQT